MNLDQKTPKTNKKIHKTNGKRNTNNYQSTYSPMPVSKKQIQPSLGKHRKEIENINGDSIPLKTKLKAFYLFWVTPTSLLTLILLILLTI